MSTLIIAEHDNVTLNPNTGQCVSAATQLSDATHVLVAGHNCQNVADQAAKLEQVSTVLYVDNAELEHASAEALSDIVMSVSDEYSCIIAAATTSGKNVIPRIAALLDVQPISDIIEVQSSDTFKRPIYAGNVIATVQSSDAKKLITIRCTAFDSVANGDACEIKSISPDLSSASSNFVGEELAKSDRPDLSAARVVISGGRGLESSDNFELLYKLADKLDAAVGASRAAVDAGYVPNDMQVGQTGKIVAPELYIAVGISGAIQHLAGMKESKVIVAINKDEDAPIFQIADYGLVADLFDAIPEMDAALS